jgi:hypothetical protein
VCSVRAPKIYWKGVYGFVVPWMLCISLTHVSSFWWNYWQKEHSSMYNRVISFVDWNWIQLFLLSMSLVSILVLSCVFPFLISQVNVYWWGKSQLRRRRIRKKLNALLTLWWLEYVNGIVALTLQDFSVLKL